MLCAALALCAACRDAPRVSTTAEAQQSAPPRLHIEGTRFVSASGAQFSWRGITAFRLVDYIADGQEVEAVKYLEWARREGLTVVRVLAMARGAFDLAPEAGRRALPRLLDLAAQHGLYVEVVALADTAAVPVNLQEHVDEIARILVAHSNGLLEIANEPVHASQSAEVQKPDVLKVMADRIPSEVLVALGSIERGDGFGAGSHVTWHSPRESGRGGWGHVLALGQGAALLAQWKKPVVNDEPIGAGPEFQPGRRDNDPSRFRAAALLTRLVGLGATFHYEGGLQARIPAGRELECFNAWNEAWTLLPLDLERQGVFRISGEQGSLVTGYDRTRVIGVYERADASAGWILVIGDEDAPLTLSGGWTVNDTRRLGGARLLTVVRPKA